jgi:hypothetical protein
MQTQGLPKTKRRKEKEREKKDVGHVNRCRVKEASV